MKIMTLLVLKCNQEGSDPVILANASDVSRFWFFQRLASKSLLSSWVGQWLNGPGQRQSVQYEGLITSCCVIINTFYNDKKIFLRELISNSSDVSGREESNAASLHATRRDFFLSKSQMEGFHIWFLEGRSQMLELADEVKALRLTTSSKFAKGRFRSKRRSDVINSTIRMANQPFP